MALSPDAIERTLLNDLQVLADLVQNDDSFYAELYRGLAGVQWHRKGDGGHVTFSWKRAEEVVNAERERLGLPPVAYAQTGGEGEVTKRVADALSGPGWHPRPEKPGVHDDAHFDSKPHAAGGA